MELTRKPARNVLPQFLLLFSLALNFACTPVVEEEKTDEEITETEEQETPSIPATPEDTAPAVDFNEYLSVSSIIGASVDDYFNQGELLKTRSLVNTDTVDTCNGEKNRNPNDQFSDQISFYTKAMMSPVSAKVGIIGSYYGSPTKDESYFPVSLMSHPLCASTTSSLSQTIKKVPSQAVIDKLNRFATTANSLREKALGGDAGAKVELMKHWGKLFSCLAYTESLSSADSSASRSVASSSAPSGYTKPSGVEFYNDPSQDAASRLNIGLFQFTPNSSGNIKPCLKAWNEFHSGSPSCKVNESGLQAEMIRVLGSSYQSFNAFCGVHKLVQTFAIQVNTTSSGSTYPGNSGKTAAARCVTPHFYAGKAYNHFGPLQNSTGENMNKLYSCIENS